MTQSHRYLNYYLLACCNVAKKLLLFYKYSVFKIKEKRTKLKLFQMDLFQLLRYNNNKIRFLY